MVLTHPKPLAHLQTRRVTLPSRDASVERVTSSVSIPGDMWRDVTTRELLDDGSHVVDLLRTQRQTAAQMVIGQCQGADALTGVARALAIIPDLAPGFIGLRAGLDQC